MNFMYDFLARLQLWQKFLIAAVIVAVAVTVPFGFYFVEAQKTIDAAKLETQGTAPAAAVLEAVRLTQKHRGLSQRFLSGDTGATAEREATQKELDAQVKKMDGVLGSIQNAKLTKFWTTAKNDWKGLETMVVSGQIQPADSFTTHSNLVGIYLDMLELIVDHFGLSLDPEPETYFMIQAILVDNPQFTESLGKMRALGSGALVKKQISPTEAVRLGGLLDNSVAQRKAALGNIQKAFALNEQIKGRLEKMTVDAGKSYEYGVKLLKEEILEAPNPQLLTYSPASYFDAYTKTIDAYSKRNAEGLKILIESLEAKAERLRTNQLSVLGGVTALLALTTMFVLFIIRSITKPVNHLVEVMDKLSSGDTSVRANLQTFDELGAMGRHFDMMVDQRELVTQQIQRENEQLNTSIIMLLQAVAKLSQRDLTVKVPVAEDVTGTISDALNLLSTETADVLMQVARIAEAVAKVSHQVKAQSETVINVATQEKHEVEQAAAELTEATAVMNDIANLASSCNTAAEKAIQTTDKAQETVLGTVQGITTIRDTIRETEKRIKRLGERSQEIGGVVNLINGIAERTHILALNASMHAASAGEAGRGFAVVANEVQRLAENSREATSKIAALVNNIQVETADTVATMNEAISQVVRGTDLAQQAGSEMRVTRDTTAELVQLVQRIAAGAHAQAEATQRLLQRAVQIQKSTEQTFEQLQNQGRQTEQLVAFSGGLVKSVNVFTLPKAAPAAA